MGMIFFSCPSNYVCLEAEFKRFVYVVDVIYDSGYVAVRWIFAFYDLNLAAAPICRVSLKFSF
jgi:hypothetical protein